jgi:hypothetical protein
MLRKERNTIPYFNAEETEIFVREGADFDGKNRR